MIATTAGRTFEIGPAPAGSVAPWHQVSEGGRPFTAEAFAALPPAAQEWIVEVVKLYAEQMGDQRMRLNSPGVATR